MTTGERIKSARKRAGLTQSELAEKLNIPYQSIGQWERNVRNPKAETLIKIANALGCEVWELSGSIKTIPLHKMDELVCGIDSLHFDVNFPKLIKYFEKLNATGQEVAIERLKELTEIPKYRREEGEQGAVDPKENE